MRAFKFVATLLAESVSGFVSMPDGVLGKIAEDGVVH